MLVDRSMKLDPFFKRSIGLDLFGVSIVVNIVNLSSANPDRIESIVLFVIMGLGAALFSDGLELTSK